jgi:hypothetical protein
MACGYEKEAGDEYNRPSIVEMSYTDKQGQYPALIYYYTKAKEGHPAEAGMQRYFRVILPSVHQMLLTREVVEVTRT